MYSFRVKLVDMDEETGETVASAAPGPTSTATVTVVAPGVEISRAVSDETMSAVIGLLFGGPAAAAPVYAATSHDAAPTHSAPAVPAAPPTRGGSQYDNRMTLGEFLTETEAKTFTQKICAAGYYLTVVKGQHDFGKDEVKTALQQAREDMPANYSRDWSSAVSSSFVAAEDKDPNRFYVPKTGRSAVESNFTELGKRRAPRRTTKKAASSNGDAE